MSKKKDACPLKPGEVVELTSCGVTKYLLRPSITIKRLPKNRYTQGEIEDRMARERVSHAKELAHIHWDTPIRLTIYTNGLWSVEVLP